MVEKVAWKPRKDAFHGTVDTRSDMNAVPRNAAVGSIIWIKDEDLFVIKNKNGIWQEFPGSLFEKN